MRRLAVTMALAAAVLASCSSSNPDKSASTASFKRLEGAPAALGGLYRQPNRLLGGGKEAFEKRIAALQRLEAQLQGTA